MTTVRPKDPDVPATYAVEVSEALIPEAARGQEYGVGDVTRAQRDTGFLYRCTVAGRTSRQYPVAWPRASGEKILDGSLEWEAVRPADANPPVIDSVTWTVPTGLTLDSQEEEAHIARATFSGGTAGKDYDVHVRIVPTVGDPIEQTITIPVRQL